MRILLDTNILLRSIDKQSPHHLICQQAIHILVQRRETLHICAQNLIESWAVASRPISSNGLGFPLHEILAAMENFETLANCLPEPPNILAQWKTLVKQHAVIGKQVHDARIVALMMAHGVEHLLTLNVADFARYRTISVLSPNDV